jgi:hypothetical protein
MKKKRIRGISLMWQTHMHTYAFTYEGISRETKGEPKE